MATFMGQTEIVLFFQHLSFVRFISHSNVAGFTHIWAQRQRMDICYCVIVNCEIPTN